MHLLKKILRNVVSITLTQIIRKQQAYDTAVTQAEGITNANGSNADEAQVQTALNQLNQAKTT